MPETYENINPNLDPVLLLLGTEVECGNGLFFSEDRVGDNWFLLFVHRFI